MRIWGEGTLVASALLGWGRVEEVGQVGWLLPPWSPFPPLSLLCILVLLLESCCALDRAPLRIRGEKEREVG